MARNQPSFTWANGFQEPLPPSTQPAWADQQYYTDIDGAKAHYTPPQQDLRPTTSMGTVMGVERLPGWPEIFDGTMGIESKAQNGETNGDGNRMINGVGEHKTSETSVSGETKEDKSREKVDVLICGGGPFGLELAVCLARAGVTFRIIDKASAPTLTGRADGVQPRALEHLHSWGLVSEFTEEGPLLNSTVLFRNGVKLFHGFSSMCDSRYKGIHVITQGQIEKVYIRDLKRRGVIIERGVVVDNFKVREKAEEGEERDIHPVKAELRNIHTGRTESVHAKYLIGADGAASKTREMMGIPFDGVTTDCYWAIMDCQFKTDFPHILGFCIIISEEHGGVIVIPREDGFTRFYTQITGEKARQLSEARSSRRNASDVGATRIDDHGITADEVLEQLNKIMTPWKVEFASAMSWFAVWRVNERVARSFSTPDQRVHIGGDAAHVHSVLGAFGLNSSIYDAANLSWKLSLSILGHARPEILLPTYDSERRLFANRVIRASGAYLRFIGNMKQPLAQLRGLGDDLETHKEDLPILDGTTEADQSFMRSFFARNAHFLLGVESPIVDSAICPTSPTDDMSVSKPTSLLNGVRIPNPRVCFSFSEAGYLYDKMTGVARFHILLFASDLLGPVRTHLVRFLKAAFGTGGFYERYGGADRFNVLVITKALPDVAVVSLGPSPELEMLRRVATVVYDDRAPDEDAHYWFGVNHARGCVVVGRPDLRVGVSAALSKGAGVVDEYLGEFLVGEGEGVVTP